MVRQITYVCLALMLALAGGLFAQGVQTATVTGTVTGPDGAPLPGVTVTASSSAQMGERTAVTGANGEYIIRGLTPGEYTIRFNLEGMQQVDREATLQLGLTSRVDAALAMTAATETIVVTGETPSALETTTVGANITKEQVDTLPVVRTPTGIASLAGAVTDRTPVAGQLSINGGMAYDNSFLINGVNVQDPIFGQTNNLFIEDSILETQVLTSGISAEYGSFTGGVMNVITKSGGNEFSGSLRGDFTKSNWRDETPFERGFRCETCPPATPIKREGPVNEVYTATLGGPFIKDRLWFFGAVRDEEDSTVRTLALTAVQVPRVATNQRIEGKLTGNITANHTLQASYIDNPVEATHEFQLTPLTLDAIGRNSVRENRGMVVSYTGVLTNNLFGEARWSEKHFGFRGLGGTAQDIVDSPFRAFSTTIHQVPVAGEFNAPYFDASDPEDRDNEILSGALSYFLGTSNFGNHDLKAGVEQFDVIRVGGNGQSSTDYVFYSGYKHDGSAPILDGQGHFIPVFRPFDGSNSYSAIGRFISTRGATASTTTTALFINDRWDFNANWSFNLGLRHEIIDSEATGNIVSIDSTSTVPRLGASFDPLGNGRFKFDVTYSQYSGRYNPAITAANTPTGNPAFLYGLYVGPAGEGRNFAPGFDPANYYFFYADVPTANVRMEDGLTSPTQHEITLSGGMQLTRNGYVKATFIDRQLRDIIETFTTLDMGCSQVVIEGTDYGCFDNKTYRNTDDLERDYRAIELQGRYSILRNWSVEGNYTRQLRNHGNYEGEGGQAIGATSFGDYPELSVDRNYPTGRLSQFQQDKVRLWTTYNFDLARAGNLAAGLIYRYDSGRTFSYSATAAYSAIQIARDPGYSSPPYAGGGTQTIFFGERGRGEFDDTSLFDLSLSYGIPVFRRVEPWIKFDVRNVLNDDTLLTHNVGIIANTNNAAGMAACGGPCPVDADGLPTTFRNGAAFGRPASAASYVIPREYFISAGIRF